MIIFIEDTCSLLGQGGGANATKQGVVVTVEKQLSTSNKTVFYLILCNLELHITC